MSVVSSINQPSIQPLNEHENKIKKIEIITLATTTFKERRLADDVKLNLPSVVNNIEPLKHVERVNVADQHKRKVSPIQKVNPIQKVMDSKINQEEDKTKLIVKITPTTATTIKTTTTTTTTKTSSQIRNNTEDK